MADNIILPQNSKAIPLTQGNYAIVDEKDYEWLSQWKWICNNYGYAVSRIQKRLTLMHRLIMSTPDGMDTDHINGDGLDNRKSNLRICTRSQNQYNRKKQSGSSKYKGVTWLKVNKKWRAQIKTNDGRPCLGCFVSEIEAATAYNAAAIKYFGEFARINHIEKL